MENYSVSSGQMSKYYRQRAAARKRAMRKSRRANLFTVLFIVIAVFALAVVFDMNGYHIVINSDDIKDAVVECGQEYKYPETTAVYRNYIFNRKGVPVEVVREGEADCSRVGSYEIKYVASYGNKTKTEKQTVKVVDTTAPVIELYSAENHFTIEGCEYNEEGYMATDNCDGNITDKVKKTEDGGVVTYTVEDSSGNKAVATRKIEYKTKEEAKALANKGYDKVVFLTFDDGPGKYTQKLLDVLDKYGAKATFFVTNQFPDYQDMIAQEAKRGHTVAVHTYSHDYSYLYSCDKAYFDDFNKMADVCKKQTGKEPKLVRLPGGSSNMISKSYCKGIMSRVTKELEKKGYEYIDWNVESMDAGGAKNSKEVAQNVIEGIQQNDASVVLQHDIHGFSVDAVEEILSWGRKNGYVFLAMDEFSPTVHHTINN